MKKSSAPKRAKSEKKRVAKGQTQKAQPKTKVPTTTGCPFRESSSYGKIYKILGSEPQGLTRADLLKRAMKATGTDERHCKYNLAVVLSAKANGKRHPSCAPGFYVERVGDLLKLRRV